MNPSCLPYGQLASCIRTLILESRDLHRRPFTVCPKTSSVRRNHLILRLGLEADPSPHNHLILGNRERCGQQQTEGLGLQVNSGAQVNRMAP